jgi:hypothetical protein
MKAMFFSLRSTLFLFLVLAVFTVAMPTPGPRQLDFQPEVREYRIDNLGTRDVEGIQGLVSRKVHISNGAKKFFGGFAHILGF